jgi:predicted MPP superfamily phosphohydrolase
VNPPHPNPRRLLLLWLGLVLMGSLIQAAAWIGDAPGLARPLSNLNTAINLPVHVPMLVLFGSRGNDNPVVILAQNAMGYGFWVLATAYLFSIRSRFRSWRLARAEARGFSPPLRRVPARHESVDPSRREFLSSAALALPAVALPGGAIYASAIEPGALRTRRLTVPIRDLPTALDGLTLVQITDTHLGPRVPASWIDHAVRTAIELSPDLFCLTGDYVGGDANAIGQAVAQFAPLLAAAPAVAVLGNHDWWADGPAFKRAFGSLGVPCVDNDRVFLSSDRVLTDTPDADALAIVGLGDLIGDITDTARAFRDVIPGQPVLLLAHEPDSAELSVLTRPGSPRVDLMLCGHTHGGQIRLPLLGTPGIPSEFGQKYASGLVRGPRFPVHVSTGVGLSMLPIRVGVPPEINHITLTRAE